MSSELRTTRDGVIIDFELQVFENFGRFSYNNASHEAFMFDQMLNISRNTSIDFVLPPVGSPWGTLLRNSTIQAGLVPFTIGIADSKEQWYRLKGSYGAPSSALQVMRSTIPYLWLNGARTSYVIRMQEAFQSELCQGFIDNAQYSDISISHVETVPFNQTTFGKPTTDADKTMWNRIADDVIAKNDHVLVICDYGEASQYIISLLKQKNWTPKAIVLSYKYAEFRDPSSAEFVIVPQSYHPDSKFPAQSNFVDSVQYNQLVWDRFGHAADYNNAQATLAGFLLSNAIMESTNSSSMASIEDALLRSQFSSFMGLSSFDIQRRQRMDNVIVQKQGGKDVVVGPVVAARSTLVYPMPTWQERSFKRQWGHATEIAGLVLMCIGTVISLGWLIFLICHWNHPVIMGSSPLFCVLILVGSIIIYASNVVWMPNLASDATCALRAWLLPIGFVLLFGALSAKTNRIYRIFQIRRLQVMSISNLQVMLIVIALLSIQIVLSAIMTFATRIKSKLFVPDAWRPSLNIHQCTSTGGLKYLYSINIACGVSLLIYGSYLARKVCKIPMRIYDESRLIHFATYNTFVFALIGCAACIVQVYVPPSFRFVTYILLSISMFGGPTLTVGMLFYSKWRVIYYPGDGISSSSSPNNSSTANHNHTTRHGHHTKATAPKNSSGGWTSSNDSYHAPSPASPPSYSHNQKPPKSLEMQKSIASAEPSVTNADVTDSQQVEIDRLNAEIAKLRKRLKRSRTSRTATLPSSD